MQTTENCAISENNSQETLFTDLANQDHKMTYYQENCTIMKIN